MAEGNKREEDGGWWSSWINTAKQQTERAFEMVSHDLAEFTSTMQSDTKKAVEKTKETLQNTEQPSDAKPGDKMKQSFFALMEGITKALTVEPEDVTPTKTLPSQPTLEIFDRAAARRRAIQVDTGTYLNEPTGDPMQYAEWLKTFDIEAQKGDISELLVSLVEVRSLYTSLVPSEVSHQDFWRRYFYKVHQLELDEARKQALMKRAERANVKEDSIGWDEGDWSGDEDSSPGKSAPVQTREDPSSRLQPPEPSQPSSSGQMSEPDKPLKAEQSKTENMTAIEEIKTVPEKADSDNGAKGVKLKHEDHNLQTGPKTDTEIPTVQDSADAKCDNVKDNVEDKIVDQTGLDKKDNNVPDAKFESAFVKQETETASEKLESEKVGRTDVTVEHEQEIEKETAVVDEKVPEDVGELKTKVRGDMVVVGDRVSPSSESSENKESSTEDWEQDFDVDITEEDLKAAHELASKLNMSSTEYNTITGEDDDWENWE